MKIMSRNFTAKEKILIGLLAVMLIGLVYYKLVYVKIDKALTDARAEAQTLQTDYDNAQMRLTQIQNMEKEMDGFKSTGLVSRMGSYNYSKPETAFLHTVLAGVPDYSITFDDVTRDGDQIRRNFSLQYRTNSYAEAQNIMKELTSGEDRCLIGDVSCSVSNGVTTISLQGTFYETMVGGTPDSALPQDEASTAEPVELEDFE